MLFDCENPILGIHSVANIKWTKHTCTVPARPYSALAFRVRGSGVIKSAGREYFVDPANLLYVPEGVSYEAEYGDTELIVIHFNTLTPDREIETFPVRKTDDVYKLFLRAYMLWNRKEAGYQGFTLSALYEILGLLCRKETEAALPDYFMLAVEKMNSSFRNSSLSISEICRNAGIGETAFRRLFRQFYKTTPIEYITELRLSCARELIAGGSTVEQAAFDSGFSDPKYFSRVVKKHLGCTPRELKIYGK